MKDLSMKYIEENQQDKKDTNSKARKHIDLPSAHNHVDDPLLDEVHL